MVTCLQETLVQLEHTGRGNNEQLSDGISASLHELQPTPGTLAQVAKTPRLYFVESVLLGESQV